MAGDLRKISFPFRRSLLISRAERHCYLMAPLVQDVSLPWGLPAGHTLDVLHTPAILNSETLPSPVSMTLESTSSLCNNSECFPAPPNQRVEALNNQTTIRPCYTLTFEPEN